MSAVTTQNFSVTVTGVPVGLMTAELVHELYSQSLGSAVNTQRQAENQDKVDQGVTGLNQSLITFNRTESTMTRQRQWNTLQAAQDKATWLDANIPSTAPTTGTLAFELGEYDGTISFTRNGTVAVQDGTTLSQTGFLTNL